MQLYILSFVGDRCAAVNIHFRSLRPFDQARALPRISQPINIEGLRIWVGYTHGIVFLNASRLPHTNAFLSTGLQPIIF